MEITLESLNLEPVSDKSVEEMTDTEARIALKSVKKNIKILEKAIGKLMAKEQAAELGEKVKAIKPKVAVKTKAKKATPDKPIVKASNKGDGTLKSVKGE